LFEKEVYIRFADEPMAFVYTVKYGGFTVKSARIPISSSGPQSAAVGGPIDDVSDTVKQLLRKPTPDSSDRAV
jgi:hypothetical protein